MCQSIFMESPFFLTKSTMIFFLQNQQLLLCNQYFIVYRINSEFYLQNQHFLRIHHVIYSESTKLDTIS